ncbi:hypothetical protein HDV05_005183 [Chytridiales sp. JEL 0842]|nr:hypothetical protein HDV05_005183 [Chytridiales sp. JEL 0842]
MELTWKNITIGLSVFAVGYIVYFDQRRQRDPKFRKYLKQQRREAAKIALDEERRRAAAANAESQAVMEAMGLMDEEEIPTTEEGKSRYLKKQLEMGEAFMVKGPAHFKSAAICLYRALKVYPNPVQLLEAFDRSVPPPVLEIIMSLLASDLEKRQGGGAAAGMGGATVQELD